MNISPKEKAAQLIKDISPCLGWLSDTLANESARQVAVMLVKEILEATKTEIDRPEMCKTIYNRYWVDVLQFLEN